MHFFRIPSDYADLFIRRLDLDKLEIEYRMFDSDGNPQEPWAVDKLLIRGAELVFGISGRTLPIPLATHISLVLHGDPAPRNA